MESLNRRCRSWIAEVAWLCAPPCDTVCGLLREPQAKTDFNATYRLLEDCVVGEGSYATVYLAAHKKVSTMNNGIL